MRWLLLIFLFFCAAAQQPNFPGSENFPLSNLFETSDQDTTIEPIEQETICETQSNWTKEEKCTYVIANSDICEGGGYLLWSRYVECEYTTVSRVFTIIGAVLYMLVMFLFVSTTADDFFSPNIAGIVQHLRIKESIAGVTLMAFGNGAPDIFASIASVLSSPTPKAGLALGELLGGAIFVSSIVVSAIILVKPFKVDWFGTTRDLIFFLIAVGWILFIFLFAEQIYVFEPVLFLGLYGLYVITVVIIQGFIYSYIKKRIKNSRRASEEAIEQNSQNHSSEEKERDANGNLAKEEKKTGIDNYGFIEDGLTSVSISPSSSSVTHSDCQDDDEVISEVILGVMKVRNTDTPDTKSIEDSDSEDNDDNSSWNWRDIPREIINHCNPIPDKEEWAEMGFFRKIHCIVTIPVTILLKITIPHCEAEWSKPVFIMHLLLSPQFFLFAIHMYTEKLFKKSPGIFVYVLAVSLILIALVLIFTRMRRAPPYYKEVYAYSGFIMSIGWIYFTSNEVVGVVTMIGLISGLSHEFLGLTILAWSNSLGDLVADPAVARQGMSRMALGAAIGGPLFNLLVGFGLPFTIATARGTVVTIAFTATCRILVIFLFLTLGTTLAAIYIQRLIVRRYHAFTLIGLYAIFILFIILTEAKVIKWGPLE